MQQEALVVALEDRKQLAYTRYAGGVDTQLNALDADRDLLRAELDLRQIKLNEPVERSPVIQSSRRWLAVTSMRSALDIMLSGQSEVGCSAGFSTSLRAILREHRG